MILKRGDICLADLDPTVGSEQAGTRPVIVIQNNVGNLYSPTVIVAIIIAKRGKGSLPTHVEVESYIKGRKKTSVVALEQIRTIDRSRLIEIIGEIDKDSQSRVNDAIRLSLNLGIIEVDFVDNHLHKLN